jgi:hypothetical protein
VLSGIALASHGLKGLGHSLSLKQHVLLLLLLLLLLLQVSGADVELNLQGSTVTVGAANGLYAGNVYEVEVYVSDSYGAVSEAATTLTGEQIASCLAFGGGAGRGRGSPA